MPVEILMPQLGLTMTEGAVSRWDKQLGDAVRAGEVILEVATEKISYELEAAVDGYLVEVRVAVDEVVPVGAVLGVIADQREAPLGSHAAPRAAAAPPAAAPAHTETAEPAAAAPAQGRSGERVLASPKARRLAAERNLNLTSVAGSGPEGLIRSKDLASGEPAAPHAASSPLAARVAQDLGVPLQGIQGSGPGGRIMSEDVRRVVDGAAAAPTPAWLVTIALPDVRKRMAQRMAQAKREIPHFYESILIDTGAMSKRKGLEMPRLAGLGLRLTYTALLGEALAQALTDFPLLTARWENESVVEHSQVHLGVATAIGDGLIVPVIHDANLLSLAGFARELQRLAAATAAGKFDPHDLEGGTFTLSNLGMYRIESFWPIINPPQCAILGVGSIEETLLVHNGVIRIAEVMKMVLAADHRIVDGVYAARFLAHLREMLEDRRPGQQA